MKYQNLIWRIEGECEKWNLEKRFEFDLEEISEGSGFYENGKSKILTGFWRDEKFVPSLKMDPRVKHEDDNTKVVFRDKDENGDLIESVGLESFVFVQGEKTGVPIYVVDNHNWALYCWAEFQVRDLKQQKKNLKLGTCSWKLVHIDAHKDEGESDFNGNLKEMSLEEVREETVKLKVSNYIKAGIQGGLIEPNFLSLTESKDFLDFDKRFKLLKSESQNIILNVDLDIFAPEVSLISLEDKVKAIGYFAANADLITFATSPGFIDQELAVAVGQSLIKYL